MKKIFKAAGKLIVKPLLLMFFGIALAFMPEEDDFKNAYYDLQ